MINLIGFWSHALAAILYAALALWRLRRWNQDPSDRRLTAALAISLRRTTAATAGPER